ncbi:metallophosphoesterase family protein [Planctomicrobium sp. SH668]|uniref:metallophosphoesterase family protein n=1 Tax=Planctomicrobium sp. SH668 TaxID=3448126 RepID=UPI003F5B4FC9
MIDRRQFMGVLPASVVALTSNAVSAIESNSGKSNGGDNRPLICSPPVIMNPRESGFDVSIAVSRLATAWVEYGFSEDDLQYVARASHHGLIQADDRVLHLRVQHQGGLPNDNPIFYRIVVQELQYENAYRLSRGQPEESPIYRVQFAHAKTRKVRVVSINDTHENKETLRKLHQRIAELQPDVLIWNGDTCNDFNAEKSTEQLLLNPAQDVTQGWASERPIVFSNGNHDVRGQKAREVPKSFVGCPESVDLPYCQALRVGPLALITLDTGEDKPDHHPVFAGTAAYEPYREQQARWLQTIVERPDIRNAPFKIAACHIPLRGLEGQPDGTTLDDFARFSGFGAKLWLPTLIKSGFHAVLSGHTHSHRVDEPSDEAPIHQFVGGGPDPDKATVTIIDVQELDSGHEMNSRVTNLNGDVFHEHRWAEKLG